MDMGKWVQWVALAALVCGTARPVVGQLDAEAQQTLDAKVSAFLDSYRGQWRDLNVPVVDGQTLHDLVVSKGYTKALEIGTSTGHSAIWIAWALSKTGGRLVTIEIDERRHGEALANFEKAGVSGFIDARLADAHELVPQLLGPFDFVFCDADKGWYTNYAIAVLPKLQAGGCFAAHNVSERSGRRGGRQSGTGEFLRYVRGVPSLETTVDSRGGGLSISCKR